MSNFNYQTPVKSKETTKLELKYQTVNTYSSRWQIQTSRLPLMPVPSKLMFVCQGGYIKFPKAIKHRQPQVTASERFKLPDRIEYEAVSIMVPEVDKIGTEYVNEQLPVRYTLAAMRFDSERSGYKSSSSENEKIGISYGLDILKAIQKESAGEVNVEYEKQWEKAFSFYINQANVYELEAESRRILEKYHEMVAAVNYIYTDNSKVLGQRKEVGYEVASGFMKNINDLIVERLENYFKNLKSQMQPFDRLKQ